MPFGPADLVGGPAYRSFGEERLVTNTAAARAYIQVQRFEDEVAERLPPGFGPGITGRIAFGIAIALALCTLWTAAYGSLPSQVVRAMHVGFLLLVTSGLVANLVAKTLP